MHHDNPSDERRAQLSRRAGGSEATAATSIVPAPPRSYGSIGPASAATPSASPILPANPPAMHLQSRLRFTEKLGYGLGHVYNDLCAGVWFSYTLLFMQGALGMASAVAGGLVMVGQVGDALATPIIGCLADRYGTKRQWHIGGTVLVLCAFPLIFSWCPWCTDATIASWWQPTYFTVVILAFQLGWAIVQITHLAMIPEIARTQTDRADLTAIRYSASVCSSVVVYVVMWLALSEGAGAAAGRPQHITPADAFRFRDVSLILTLIGVSMAMCFHFSLAVSGYSSRRQHALDHSNIAHSSSSTATARRRSSTPPHSTATAPLLDDSSAETTTTTSASSTSSSQQSSGPPTPGARKNFFRSPLLYQNAFLYVFSRLFCTTALVYIPLWLDERSWTPAASVAALPSYANRFRPVLQPVPGDADGGGNVAHIAIIPLVSFVASFVASIWMKLANRWIGPKLAYLVGSIGSVSACLWVALAAPAAASTLMLCAIAVLFGASSSVTMISSLCITADMIGQHADQSGFIYSAVTFADKLITGVVVIVIEALKCHKRSECPEYYRNVLAYACGLSACLGLLTLATLQCGRRRRSPSPYTRV